MYDKFVELMEYEFKLDLDEFDDFSWGLWDSAKIMSQIIYLES